MSSTELLQAIVDGILTGGVYALMAAGLTLIFGVMDIINIAQGVMVVLGAYLSYELSVHLGIGLLPGLLITVPAMFLLGVAMEFFFMRRLRDADRTGMSILVTFAIAILIEGILSAIFGVDYVQLHASYVDKSVHVLGFYLPYIYLIGFALAVLLMAALYYMLYRTKFGRAVRASLQNRTAADLIGINVNRTRTISVGIGVAVTAIGGMVFGATTAFNPSSGYELISRLLAIVILAGMGSIGGGMVAAVFLLLINDVVAVAWSPTWAPLVFFAVLVVVLSVRPQGLFWAIGSARPVSEPALSELEDRTPVLRADARRAARARGGDRPPARRGVCRVFPVAITDLTATRSRSR
jgi:branched-chain amino acid transport system permease protein